MKECIKKDLQKRYEDTDVKDFLLLSSVLDPRFKSLPNENAATRNDVYSSLILKCAGLSTTVKVENTDDGQSDNTSGITEPNLPILPDSQQIQTNKLSTVIDNKSSLIPFENQKEILEVEGVDKKSAMEGLFGDVYVTKVEAGKSPSVLAEEEVTRYRNVPVIPIANDPLEWWKENEYVFPTLAQLAKMYLSIPSTSVPSERVFSTAGDVVTAQRAMLQSENVDRLIFLKKNMKQ